jgi:hypothetical protein
LAKNKYFYFLRIISKEIIIASLYIIKAKPFLTYLPSIMHMEYFSIICNVKKCTLYSIKYSTNKHTLFISMLLGRVGAFPRKEGGKQEFAGLAPSSQTIGSLFRTP